MERAAENGEVEKLKEVSTHMYMYFQQHVRVHMHMCIVVGFTYIRFRVL